MIKIVIFTRRKPGMTPLEFQNYYENKHVVLAKPYVEKWMLDHFRIYPGDVRAMPDDWAHPEAMPEREPPYDAVSVYSFKDEAAVQEYMQFMADPEISEMFTTDELRFIDRLEGLSGPCVVHEGKGVTNHPSAQATLVE